MDKLISKFSELFGEKDNLQVFFCPGRVNLIGEHIDYLGGSVMPTAISLGITAVIHADASDRITVHSLDFDERIQFDLNDLSSIRKNHWSDFVLGVLLHFKQEELKICGATILLQSTLPQSSGLSSSAAMEVLCFYMLHLLSGHGEPDRVRMAVDCQRIENRFIGVNCGIMDQFAVANSRSGHAIVLQCATLQHEFIPLILKEHSLLIINTHKPRTLAESAYNQRRRDCEEALRRIAQQKPIENLVDASLDDLKFLDDPLLEKRARHAISEQMRVNGSAKALRTGDLREFGRLMQESHQSLRDDLEVSCAELDHVTNALNSDVHCLGARMTGAGFGGCCIALVASEHIENVTSPLAHSYHERFGIRPSFHTCLPVDGVHRII